MAAHRLRRKHIRRNRQKLRTEYPLSLIRDLPSPVPELQCQWIDRQGKSTDSRTYHCIAEDLSALQLAPQVFVRKNTKTENEKRISKNIPEKTEKVSSSTSEEKAKSTLPSAGNSHTTCIVNNDEWKNIGKQNPFYAEASKILSGKLTETDAENRQVILNYVEHLRTSYTTKDIDFLTQLFSEECTDYCRQSHPQYSPNRREIPATTPSGI